MRRAVGAALALTLAWAGASCGGDDGPVVLAASSLRAALDGEGPAARLSFAASGTIAAQIRQGAAADVVVLADSRVMDALSREGLVQGRVAVAGNALAVLVPSGGAGVTDVADLARRGLRLAVATPGVPLGDYTRQALAHLGAQRVLANVVTEEPDAAGVLGKVSLGQVDAGIGYVSDLRSGRVRGFALPDAAQPDIRYEAAIAAGAPRPRQAREYLEWLSGPRGAAALRSAGFTAR